MKKVVLSLLAVICSMVSASGQQMTKCDEFKTAHGKSVKIFALLHASIRIVYDGKEIEVDPVSKLGNRTTDYAAFPKADYILLTHEHGDHFDKGAIGLLTVDGLRIYIAGDTEYIPEMKTIKDIDVAFMPCNQPYTMTTEQLVRAAKTVKPKVLYPYHYGRTDLSTIPAQLKSAGIDVRLRPFD